MRVETVTAAGFGLLQAVRDTLASSNDSMLCVAFAHERGVRLLGKELEAAHRRGGKARLLVTTAFDRGGTTGDALAVARSFGVEVRIHNHSGGTYHPKLYLGSSGTAASAVIGSANLTAGLACNVEIGVALSGARSNPALARAWEVGEALWADARRTRGELTNTTLLNQLRVHRSSAVCALLARIPGVQASSARPIALRWKGSV